MAEQAQFKHGGVTYPLTSALTNSLLRDADPSLYYVSDYIQSVLQTYVGARLAAEAAVIGLSTGNNAITAAVGTFLPYDPATVRLESQIGKWPLLAVWRQSGKYRWRTVARHETQATWKVAYVLPPLTPAQRERLAPVLASVPKVILNRIENHFDPAYASGADFMALAGLDEINLVEDSWGSFDIPDTQLVFPAWMGSLFVVERDENMPAGAAGGAMAGVDVAIPVHDPTAGDLDGIVDFATDKDVLAQP